MRLAGSNWMDLTAYVPQNIIDLLSTFLPNRRAEVGPLRQALEADDWVRLQHLAERMYALGNPYGFRQITTFGRFMREACANKDRPAVHALIHDYETYLSKVTIVEVEAPMPREVLTPNAREALLAMMAAPNDGGRRRRRTGGGGGSRTTRKERQT